MRYPGASKTQTTKRPLRSRAAGYQNIKRWDRITQGRSVLRRQCCTLSGKGHAKAPNVKQLYFLWRSSNGTNHCNDPWLINVLSLLSLHQNGGVTPNNELGNVGASLLEEESAIAVTGGVFDNNQARNGGVIFSGKDSALLVKGGNFSGNVAENGGGAIYVDVDGQFKVSLRGRSTGKSGVRNIIFCLHRSLCGKRPRLFLLRHGLVSRRFLSRYVVIV